MVEQPGSILVFANGVLEEGDWIEPYFGQSTAVIAANGGTRHLLALGRRPDILVGDLDSLKEGVRETLLAAGVEIVERPSAKDETDLELALLLAGRRFPQADIQIFGGIGGRLDQTLANILLLAHPELIDRPIRFVERRESAWLVTNETVIDGHLGDIVSLIPLSGPADVIETTGLLWPLHHETLEFGLARGISNVMSAERATVKLADGMVLCVHRTATGDR